MFKKKPQIKNLSPLRSSDRRKLADQIISEYQIPLPDPPETLGESDSANQDRSSLTTIAFLRTLLLPENSSSGRFTTHAGPDAKLVSGTVYVGSHPDQEERILWFQLGLSDPRVYPTVYTLWHYARLVPLVHTLGSVVEKLQTGADLMTPGLTNGPPFPEKAKKSAIVAVASVERPDLPACVGVCEIDVSALEKVQGSKGRAVRPVHWEGDELWAWSLTGTGGRRSPGSIEGGQGPSEGVKSLSADGDDADSHEDGGVLLDVSGRQARHDKGSEEADQTVEVEAEPEPEPKPEPSTREIDEAFYNAFLYALNNARQSGSPPQCGISFPINPSSLISNIIQPCLPMDLTTQAQYFTMKKTSWKNTKKFIKHLDRQGLVKSKDRSGGETVIVDIDFDHPQILGFIPYRLAKAPDKNNDGKGTGHGTQAPSGPPCDISSDSSITPKLNLQVLIRPSPKLVPELLPSKTSFYTPTEVASYLRTFIAQNSELTTQSSSPRFIKLNPFLANTIFSSNGNGKSSTLQADTRVLAAGEVARDVLQKRILEDSHLCQPYWVLLHGGQRWSHSEHDNTSLPKPKPGAAPRLSITVEKRTGSKTVTRIAGLEVFGISPEVLAGELQKKCASSTSVGQLVGGKPGTMEVLVQGDHRGVVEREVGIRGVRKEWVEVLDKLKGKGKK